MKVLMAHKFYYDRGGTEQYLKELSNILLSHGHEVIPFSMKDSRNWKTEYEDYFVDNIEYESPTWYKIKNFHRIIGKVIYSHDSKRKIERLIQNTTPDIAHIQLIDHHISPSILPSLKKSRIPVIQSINTYKLVCPSYRLYNMRTQKICEKCLNRKYYHALLDRCLKNSFFASALATAEMYTHKKLKIYEKNIDRFIVASDFMKEKILQIGIEEKKIVKILNPLNVYDYSPSFENGNFLLYFGRIDPEKGVFSLVKAMEHLPSVELIVVGMGSEEEKLKNFVESYGMKNVRFAGPKWGEDLLVFLYKATAVVVPSIWYEVSPVVIYQAFAAGKPVIGSKIGGIPELIEEEKDGLLFRPGDINDLSSKINIMMQNPDKAKYWGMNARKKAECLFNPEAHYNKIMDVYQEVLDKNR
jgi:glycosyltransferase involved in cell wall biosynthesis